VKFFLLLYAFFELFFIILAIKTLGFGIYALEMVDFSAILAEFLVIYLESLVLLLAQWH